MILEIREFIEHYIESRLRGRRRRALEEEVARLRAENWALVNSILGIAGIPPVRAATKVRGVLQQARGEHKSIGERAEPGLFFKRAGKTASGINLFLQRHDRAGRHLADSAERRSRDACLPGHEAPLRGVRRRSWQQIGRALEVEDVRAARRERESDTDAFPAPGNIVPRV